MKTPRTITLTDAAAVFDRAVAERALAVLTLPQDNGWAVLKSRFLERDPQGRFFVLDYVSPDGSPLPVLSPGQYVGVSFRQSSRKILFATIVEAKGHFVLDDRSTIPAIRYRWPQNLTELQRRAYYRTPVPPEMTLPAVLWPGGAAARPAGSQGTTTTVGVLADISCGGALIHLHQVAPPGWSGDELLGAELHLPDGRPPLVLDARYRGTRADPSGLLAVAVQFLGLELTNEGRQTLQRLAACVQRLHRLTMAAGQRDLGF